MEEKIFIAPAKINFGLNVVRKRQDGYHDIETIFYPVSLADKIKIKPSNNLTLITNSSELNQVQDNLVLKAVRLLQEFTGKEMPVEISLDKNIPIGAGLGGGSSDASAVLKGLNELFNLNIPKTELLKLALQIGSDAPFFIDPKPVFATARGEVMEQINFHIPFPVLLVNPGIHSSTKAAYAGIIPKVPEISLNQIVSSETSFKTYKYIIFNDFEDSIISKYEQLLFIKRDLYNNGALFALMTGSGSTFFGVFNDQEQAKQAAHHFREQGYFTYIT